MRDRLLFSYMIEEEKVDVYLLDFPKESSFMTEEFFYGLTAAIAEYLYYPHDIIAPRIHSSAVEFVSESEALPLLMPLIGEYVQECTQKAVLEFMEQSEENAKLLLPDYVTTPNLSAENINCWCNNLKEMAAAEKVSLQKIKKRKKPFCWLKFSYCEDSFYGRYLDTETSEYLLVSLPGYRAEWNDLSPYMQGRYDVLQLSPLGYNTPYGYDDTKKVRGAWPVLYDTVCETNETVGYNKWFFEVALAIGAIRKPGQKLIFIGTSQGGGAALVLASLFCETTVVCAAEMPFLIGFSGTNFQKVRDFVAGQFSDSEEMIYDFCAKERLSFVDPLRHSRRITCPTLLVAGENDRECPKEDIFALYNELSCRKEYVELSGQEHGYTKAFEERAVGWIEDAITEEERRMKNESKQ